jgi:hypothetical protein
MAYSAHHDFEGELYDFDSTALLSHHDHPSDNMSDSSGKAPLNGAGSSHHPAELIKVEPPRREDLQPSYAREIQPDTEDEAIHGWYGGMINGLGTIIGTLGAVPCCIICPNPYRPVEQGNVGLVTKFGRFARAVDPGLVKVNPLSERLIQVDVKIQIVGMFHAILLLTGAY